MDPKLLIKLVLFCAVLILPLVSFSQSLTLSNLISFINSDISVINETLLIKKWKFIDSDLKDKRNDVTWAFEYNKDDDSALSWLSVSTRPGAPHRIYYIMHNDEHHKLILQSIKDLKSKMTYSNTDKDGLQTIYMSANYVYRLNYKTDGCLLEMWKRSDYFEDFSRKIKEHIKPGDTTYIDTLNTN